MMLEFLRDKTVLVTGATGLIGSALVELLLDAVRERQLETDIVAAGRSVEKLEKRFGRQRHLTFLEYDALKSFEYDGKLDVIIHAASPASPDLFVGKPVETMMANINGVHGILEYASKHKGTKVVYVSSSEVYGQAAPRENGFKEEDSGYVDILSPRSSYPMGKRAAETLCASYAAEHGVDVSIVRPGHIYGPTATENDRRVSSIWPRQAARGEAIVMKSAGAQERSYTHCYDCATAILAVAEKGKPGEAYNVGNPASPCSIRRLAETIAKIGNVELRTEIAPQSELKSFSPMTNSMLDASKLVALGWKAKYDIESGIADTMAHIR